MANDCCKGTGTRVFERYSRCNDSAGTKAFCTALPNSQGQDWKTDYAVQYEVPDGVARKLAYVECDYVA